MSTFEKLAVMVETPRKIHLTKQNCLHPLIYKIVEWTLTVGNCCREEASSDPAVVVVAFAIIIIHNGVLQRNSAPLPD